MKPTKKEADACQRHTSTHLPNNIAQAVESVNSSLPPALAALGAYRQFILCRFAPSTSRPGKTDKLPCAPSGIVANAHDPANWLDHESAYTLASMFGADYGVGFVLTRNDPFFCLDIDGCLQPNNAWSPIALEICATLPGAAEISNSGTGMHKWGQYSDTLPPFSCKNTSFGLELYTEGRFIALGTGAIGDASLDATSQLAPIIGKYFAPTATSSPVDAEWTTAPRSDWAGPSDDDELIRRMLAAKPSTASVFGGKATLAQLWAADAVALAKSYPDPNGTSGYGASEADAALAQHLAFWTGCDCERIQRLMKRSALNRDKYDREDYLPRTIRKAVAICQTVYTEPVSVARYDREPMPHEIFNTHGAPPVGMRPVGDSARAAAGFTLLSSGDLRKLPAQDWLVKGVLPMQGVAAIFGGPGSAKSFLVLDLANAIGDGKPCFGYKSQKCRLTIVSLEGEAGLQNRVGAYALRYGSASENVFYVLQPFNLLNPADIAALAAAVKANGSSVVIIDTLNQAAPGADENDSAAMGLIIAGAKQLATLIGGLVVLVHHTGKDASKGLRGHSSLHAALDAAIEVRRTGDYREWINAKSKDGIDGVAHPFKLQVVELGIDADGDPITSCVICPTDGKVAPNIANPFKYHADKLAVLRVINDFHLRGHSIGISPFSPTHNAFALLQFEPNYPEGLTKDQLFAVISDCQKAGYITPEDYKKPDRKLSQRWILTPSGLRIIGVEN
ncbi:MAG: AAA family ATPase [Nitrosomonadales bacterium]|nr:AAA family ATPase [Nitrosomonadales bacterium]